MAGKPQDRQMVQNARVAQTDSGEPLHTEQMSVYDNGGSHVVGVTSFGRKLHRLADGRRVDVEVYQEGIWIDLGGDDGD